MWDLRYTTKIISNEDTTYPYNLQKSVILDVYTGHRTLIQLRYLI